MNEREHVLNAALLAIGLGVIIDPSLGISTMIVIGEVFVPIVLGALFPDVDAHCDILPVVNDRASHTVGMPVSRRRWQWVSTLETV